MSHVLRFRFVLDVGKVNIEVSFQSPPDNILIDRGLTPFSIIIQSYHSGKFNYPCVAWLSHNSS